MKSPLLKNQAFLEAVQSGLSEFGQLKIWWLGQSGFLIQWKGQHLLLDPYLSDSLTRKYATTDKPHIRMTERVVRPDQLSFVKIVTSSHNHTDHLDAETLLPLFKANPDIRFIIPQSNREFILDRCRNSGPEPDGLDSGTHITIEGSRITGIPAAHEVLERDDQGRCRYLGYLIQFDEWTIYHSGDTVVFEGLAEILSKHSIDVAMLPINGSAPERRVAGNMNGEEAVELAVASGIKMVIPCHFDMFEFNTVKPDEFISSARKKGQRIAVSQNGEAWIGSQSDL